MPRSKPSASSGTIHCREQNCTRTFTNPNSEIRHYGSTHGPRARWRRTGHILCPANCGVGFTNQQSMRVHLRDEHKLDNWRQLMPTSGDFRAIIKGKKRGRPALDKDNTAEVSLLPTRDNLPAEVHTNGHSKPINPKLEIARYAYKANRAELFSVANAYARAFSEALRILDNNFTSLENM